MALSNSKFNSTVLDALADTVLIVDLELTILDCLPGDAKETLGCTQDWIGNSLTKYWSTDQTDQFGYYVDQCLKENQMQVCEFRILTREGQEFVFEGRFQGTEANQVTAMLRDITQRKMAEGRLVNMMLQLEESHDNLTSILNQLRIGTALVNEIGRLTFLSEACLELTKIDREVLNEDWHFALPFTESECIQVEDMMALSPKKRVKIPIQVGRSWIDLEIKDHPQNPKKKIFLFYDVSEVHQLKQRLSEQSHFYGMVGQSSVMQQIFHQIRELADLEVTVLIQGETGTGKELVARALHQHSKRRKAPFVAVNCAGLTDGDLLKSQLFGHRKGSFTGAVQDQVGMLEAADGGVLFLDELGDIPMDVQTSLLRFLQDREVIRIGESQGRKVDVRIIAASQYDLKQRVDAGLFRMDLFYRIHVASILLPPLRERMEDVPVLASEILSQMRDRVGKEIRQVSRDVLSALMQHDWPGNVRELFGVLEAAAVRASSSVIEFQDLPAGIGVPESMSPALPEKDRIQGALKEAGGNRSRAAQLLGMSRATLYRRLESLNI